MSSPILPWKNPDDIYSITQVPDASIADFTHITSDAHGRTSHTHRKNVPTIEPVAVLLEVSYDRERRGFMEIMQLSKIAHATDGLLFTVAESRRSCAKEKEKEDRRKKIRAQKEGIWKMQEQQRGKGGHEEDVFSQEFIQEQKERKNVYKHEWSMGKTAQN